LIKRLRGELENTQTQGAAAKGQIAYLTDSKEQLEQKVASLQSEVHETRSKVRSRTVAGQPHFNARLCERTHENCGVFTL
jgi:phage shock protein A